MDIRILIRIKYQTHEIYKEGSVESLLRSMLVEILLDNSDKNEKNVQHFA